MPLLEQLAHPIAVEAPLRGMSPQQQVVLAVIPLVRRQPGWRVRTEQDARPRIDQNPACAGERGAEIATEPGRATTTLAVARPDSAGRRPIRAAVVGVVG
jgi:hypothetical protein